MLSLLRHLLGLQRKTIVIPAASATPLTERERMELREWLKLPLTQRALALMESAHPGTRLRMPSYARSEWDERAAVSFLNRIKGWESYRDQLLQIAEPERSAEEIHESYPSQD